MMPNKVLQQESPHMYATTPTWRRTIGKVHSSCRGALNVVAGSLILWTVKQNYRDRDRDRDRETYARLNI
jgi:hypothetical protein